MRTPLFSCVEFEKKSNIRIEVIFTALVDDAQITILLGILIGNNTIDLVQLQ